MPDHDTLVYGCVLVVEDDPIISLDASETLRELGFDEVRVAHGIATALDHLARTPPPRAALLDLDLKGESAAPVATAARAAGVAFVVASGHPDPGGDPAFAGAPVLAKPYGKDQLRAALTRALAESTRASPVESRARKVNDEA